MAKVVLLVRDVHWKMVADEVEMASFWRTTNHLSFPFVYGDIQTIKYVKQWLSANKRAISLTRQVFVADQIFQFQLVGDSLATTIQWGHQRNSWNMSNNGCRPTRGLFIWPDKSWWWTKYYNFNWSATDRRLIGDHNTKKFVGHIFILFTPIFCLCWYWLVVGK